MNWPRETCCEGHNRPVDEIETIGLACGSCVELQLVRHRALAMCPGCILFLIKYPHIERMYRTLFDRPLAADVVDQARQPLPPAASR